MKLDELLEEIKKSCWKGYKKRGTKIKDGKRVNNCVKENIDKPSNPVLTESMDNVKFERWWKLQGLDSQNNSELFKSVARHAWGQSTKHPSDYFGFGQEDEHEEGKRRRQERLNASAEQSDREYYK